MKSEGNSGNIAKCYAPTSPKKEQQTVGVELALPKENPETVLKKGRAISAPTSPKEEQQSVGVELALPKNPLLDYNKEKGRASSAPTSPKKEQQTVGVELALPKTDPQNLLKNGSASYAPTFSLHINNKNNEIQS